MANEVKFNIKLVVDGKEKIVDATADIKKFAQDEWHFTFCLPLP